MEMEKDHTKSDEPQVVRQSRWRSSQNPVHRIETGQVKCPMPSGAAGNQG